MGYFVRFRDVIKGAIKVKVKRRGEEDGGRSNKRRTYQHYSTSVQLQEAHNLAHWPDRSF